MDGWVNILSLPLSFSALFPLFSTHAPLSLSLSLSLSLAERDLVRDPGAVRQKGKPLNVYLAPVHLAAAAASRYGT